MVSQRVARIDKQFPREYYKRMKTYIVYMDGVEVGLIKASGHNAAEKKAQKKYGEKNPGKNISVEYTEI
jgi:hypothetical protein